MLLAMKRLALALLLSFVATGECAIQSVQELEKIMYNVIDGTPCIRLVNLYGESGCANPGRDIVSAPIHRLTTLEISYTQPMTLLLPYSLFHLFLEKTVHDSSFASKVTGVLLEYEQNANFTVNSSPEQMFPQAEFAPYSDKSYQWNPWGTGVLHKRFDFPVYLLSEESTKLLQEVAAQNDAQNTKYPVQIAEFDVVMQTTKSRTHTSESCLKEWSCLPLGGYSVISALPSNNSSSIRPVLLVMATMDSVSFFRDSTPGADSSVSGMIALLAAVDALSKLDRFAMKKQVVFSLFNGEAWGYLGSRRFLHELESGGTLVSGLNFSDINQIIEVGSVGRAVDDILYAHSQDKQASSLTSEIVAALKISAESLGLQLKTANKQNPGVPPSSMMSFLHKNSSVAGVVLEDFDTAFTNSFYHSHLDSAGNVNHSAIEAAAAVIARTVYQLANSDSTFKASDVGSVNVNASLVKELVSCLLTANPGMQCELVKSLITPTEPVANHYVGVFLGDPSSPPLSENLDDTTKFIWNFLADRTKRTDRAASSEHCADQCKDTNEICVGATSEHKGLCVVSTTRYVPAYSTRLKYKSGNWELLPIEVGDFMDNIDPVWTESFWKSLTLRVYLRDDPSFDRLVLLAGCCITIASSIAILAAKAVFRKRLKSA